MVYQVSGIIKKLLVSDTALRYLMSRQLKKFTPRYKQMCGCEICIHSKQLQSTLKSWRRRHAANKNRYKYVVFPDGIVLHETTRDNKRCSQYNDSRQYASTTHAHMVSMLTELRKNKQLKQRCTIWESTDGYCKQYRCGTALFFKSIVSTDFNIIVDRIIGAPGYEKDVVDGINSCNKRYLMG